jgi:UDP-N-acetylglucosamine 1-carboxyvinyltransferase
MKSYIIKGGNPLQGTIRISGSKNVVTKAVIAACLTSEPVTLKNVPEISDIDALLDVIESIGGTVERQNGQVTITVDQIKNHTISLAEGARVRTSSMFIAPLLLRTGNAVVPNPEGCRLGARPIERHIEGLEKMGATIEYKSEDGYYHATTDGLKGTTYRFEKNTHTGTETLIMASTLAKGTTIIENAAEEHEIDDLIEGLEKMGATIEYKSEDGYYHATTDGLKGTTYRFEKNTHTGTETLIMASTLAKGTTIIENAAEEHEIDDLISLLNSMGAKIKRIEGRKIEITGVEQLHGTTYEIVSDGNELVTFAVLSILTGGNILLENANLDNVGEFLSELSKAGASYEIIDGKVRFFAQDGLNPTDVVTNPEPGFKTDWQGPWAILMTQARGFSTIHETIYENRFGYVSELRKMGAKIDFFNPEVTDPQSLYNFNYDPQVSYKQAIKIDGPKNLHNAVLTVSDLRAGATVVIASLIAKGESVIYGIEHIERGYEKFVDRLSQVGADIKEVGDDK